MSVDSKSGIQHLGMVRMDIMGNNCYRSLLGSFANELRFQRTENKNDKILWGKIPKRCYIGKASKDDEMTCPMKFPQSMFSKN